MAVSDSVQDEGLVRVFGTGGLGFSVVNMVVGAGIFVLPGLVAVRALEIASQALENSSSVRHTLDTRTDL